MELPGLDEPVGLRARAATDPDTVRTQIASGRLLVTPLWKVWGPVLEPAGVDRATLSAILRGHAYEMWLWVAGERTWAQCLEGLAGRVSRRVGARSPATKARRSTGATKATKATRATRGRRPTAKATKTTWARQPTAKGAKARTAGGAKTAGRPRAATSSGRAAKTTAAKKTGVKKTGVKKTRRR